MKRKVEWGPPDRCQTCGGFLAWIGLFIHLWIQCCYGFSRGCYKLTSLNNSFRSNSNSIISCFDAITPSDVVKIMKKSCKRTSPLDPFLHQVFNLCTKPLSSAIAKLVNMSFQEGHFPSIYKTTQITPLLKKPNLDPTVPEHFRPISNLSTISKIVERAILIQLRSHITNNHNFPSFQSAYHSNHSTETALLHILDEVYVGCDNKKASILTSLDLSAAFGTIDHRILLERLSRDFGIERLALKWLDSYLTERKQFVKLGPHSSYTVTIEHGVPQGSVLGPLLFTTCISSFSSIFNNFNLTHHQYADDIQILIKINPHNLSNSISTLTDCFKMIERWFLLQLNTSKTEVIKIGTPQQLNKFSSLSSINFGSTSIDLSKSPRNHYWWEIIILLPYYNCHSFM